MQDHMNPSSNRITQEQLKANRENARRSTGARSQAGKARSSQNAIKHGFYAKAVVLQGEDAAAFERLKEQVWTALAPTNPLEEILVKEIIDTQWRLGRLHGVEALVFTRQYARVSEGPADSAFSFLKDAQGLDGFGKLSRYEEALTRRLYRALKELRAVRKQGWQTALPQPTPPSDPPATPPEEALRPAPTQAASQEVGVEPSALVPVQPPSASLPEVTPHVGGNGDGHLEVVEWAQPSGADHPEEQTTKQAVQGGSA